MNAERVASLFWFLLGVAAAYGGFDLGLENEGEPGSGFLTFIAGIFVAVMAAIIFFQSYRASAEESPRIADLWRGVNWKRAVAIVLLTLVFILSFETAGFLICSFVLLVIIMRGLEGLSWKISLVLPAITVLATYVLFTFILKTSLPAGVLGF